ncbi:MAG: peptide-methionine (S)-S-oxide reductase MsrA [Mesorhizobium sp.]
MFFLSDMLNKKLHLPKAGEALPGRSQPIPTARTHTIYKRPLKSDAPEGFDTIYFGMGCFWGVERLFWQTPGVWLTASGYQGGETPNPTYQETCTGMTGHAETVKVIFDPKEVSLATLLSIFWESHDPTQGMRQGNDVGTTYRSAIYTTTDAQLEQVLASRDAYQDALKSAGRDSITTEIGPAPVFYYAEDYHQQYLDKNPNGYCGLRGTGVSCPIPASTSA